MSDKSDRRFFGTTERSALYLAADGRCTKCGTELEPGWHAVVTAERAAHQARHTPGETP